MSDDPPARALMTLATNGDKQAWDALVERYAPLAWSICRRYQLSSAAAADVGQAIWLQFMDHLGKVRDLATLTGWLAATTQRECGKVQRAAHGPHAAGKTLTAETIPDDQTGNAEQELPAERHAMLREAFIGMPPCCQRLTALLTADPPRRTPRSAPSWASLPAASGPGAAAAWTSCAAAARGELSRRQRYNVNDRSKAALTDALPRQKSG
jgi:RNA polymerase sigma factor (sigma-70 family)